MTSQARSAREIFSDAVENVSPERWPEFLDRECNNDPILRSHVQRLLDAQREMDGFMEKPAAEPAPTIDSRLGAALGTEIGPYKLREQIGEGGFGVVYVAEQSTPVRRKVALKIIKPGMDSREVIARFEAERQALALMDHANVARVLDAGTTDSGLPYFVMELIHGVPITEFCDKNKLPTSNRLELFADVCSAVQHAHQKGVIHRDLKPSNILVTLRDGVPVPKVIDFGVSKALSQQLTEKTVYTSYGQVIGTPQYMSPEQAEMSELGIDTRSDIYSLGVLLYELLTGKTPVDKRRLLASGYGEMMRIIREEEPPRPSTRVSTLGEEACTIAQDRQTDAKALSRWLQGDLDRIVMKALDKDRTRRYETANAFRLDVQRFLNDEPVTAVAPSVVYRMRKFARRNKLLVAASASVAAALVLGVTVATWQAIRANSNAQFATLKTDEANRALIQADTSRREEIRQRKFAEENARRANEQRYTSDLIVAQHAIAELDAKLGIDILESHSAEPGERDLRGWLWRYLRGQLAQEQRMVRALGGACELAVSPDGRLLAVGGRAGAELGIRILSLPDLTVRQTLARPRGAYWISGMRFSADNSRLVVECYAGRVGVLEFNVVTGAMRSLNPPSLQDERGMLKLSADGRWLIGMFHQGANTRSLKSFDAATGREVGESPSFTTPNQYMLDHEMRISPDATLVTAGCAGGALRIFSVPELREVRTIQAAGDVSVVAWSPGGELLATACDYPKVVDLWKVESGDHHARLSSKFVGSGWELCFSPDGTKLAGSDLGNVICVWDTATQKLIRSFPGHREGMIWSLQFLPDSVTLASVGREGTVKIWDTSPPDGTDLRKLNQEHQFPQVKYSPDGRIIATATPDGVVRLFDAETERLMDSLHPAEHSQGRGPVLTWTRQLAFSSDGQTLVAGNGDHTATVYDLTSRSAKFLLEDHRAALVNLVVSADDRLIAACAEDKTVIVWEAATGRKLKQIQGPKYMDFHPDPGSRWLAVADGNRVSLIDVDTEQQRSSVESYDTYSVTFSPDGNTIAVGAVDQVRLYRVPELELIDTIIGPRGPVPTVAFHPDGGALAIPSWGGLLQVWNAEVGGIVGRLLVPRDWTISAQFSPDGATLAATTRGVGVHLFAAPSMSQIEHWQREEQLGTERLTRLRKELFVAGKQLRAAERSKREVRFAQDAGAINQWLVLGPVPLEPAEQESTARHFSDEGALLPRVGAEEHINGATFAWRAQEQRDPLLDFEEIYSSELLDADLDDKVAYAVTYVISDRTREDLHLKIGSDDQAVLYLNGKELYRHATPRAYRLDQDDVAGIQLEEGLNRLVFKVANQTLGWAGSVRFTNANGEPVEGMRVTLDPGDNR